MPVHTKGIMEYPSQMEYPFVYAPSTPCGKTTFSVYCTNRGWGHTGMRLVFTFAHGGVMEYCASQNSTPVLGNRIPRESWPWFLWPSCAAGELQLFVVYLTFSNLRTFCKKLLPILNSLKQTLCEYKSITISMNGRTFENLIN